MTTKYEPGNVRGFAEDLALTMKDATQEKVHRSLVSRARRSPELQADMVAYAAAELARFAMQAVRRATSTPSQVVEEAVERGRRAQRSDAGTRKNAWAARTIMDMPLPIAGQPRLGSAKEGDLTRAAEFYEGNARTFRRQGKWMRGLEAKLRGTGKAVEDVLGIQEVEEIRAAA